MNPRGDLNGCFREVGCPVYREAKGGALRLGRVAARWDKFPGSRLWLLSSATRSRPLPLLRAGVKGSGQECPLYTNQSSGRSTNPRSFTGTTEWSERNSPFSWPKVSRGHAGLTTRIRDNQRAPARRRRPCKARNRAKSLVLEYFTLSHLESKTKWKIRS